MATLGEGGQGAWEQYSTLNMQKRVLAFYVTIYFCERNSFIMFSLMFTLCVVICNCYKWKLFWFDFDFLLYRINHLTLLIWKNNLLFSWQIKNAVWILILIYLDRPNFF